MMDLMVEVVEYEINGIYAGNYPFSNLIEGRRPSLLIDEDNYLDIGGGKRLNIM